jgi:hypothetical protein
METKEDTVKGHGAQTSADVAADVAVEVDGEANKTLRPDDPMDLQAQEPEGDELEELLAMPEKIEVGGEEYRLSPLGINGMGDLRKWAKKQIRVELDDNLKLMEGAPGTIIEDLWNRAALQLRDPLTSDAMETPEAIAYWILTSLQKEHPGADENLVKTIIDEYSIKRLLALLMRLNGISKESLGNPTIAEALMKRRERTGRPSS